jgi:hypothetical protein
MLVRLYNDYVYADISQWPKPSEKEPEPKEKEDEETEKNE